MSVDFPRKERPLLRIHMYIICVKFFAIISVKILLVTKNNCFHWLRYEANVFDLKEEKFVLYHLQLVNDLFCLSILMCNQILMRWSYDIRSLLNGKLRVKTGLVIQEEN